MKFEPKIKQMGRKFTTVDSHTMGEATRIILDGFPELKGNSMMEKKQYLEKHCDDYRKALMLEPRGHRDMFGALLTDPVSAEADIGVIFMDSGGYLNMCGHGSIGSATIAVEAGLVEVVEPYTTVVLEAPAGIIRAKVHVVEGKAREVSILNVPSFLYKENLEVTLGEYGTVTFDISFGGSFFALVDSEKIGIPIEQKNLDKLTDFGMKLLDKINKTISVKHPYLDITTVDLVEIYGPSDKEGVDKRNVVIFGESQADRSPCGTGTSAKVATLYARGQLKLNEEFVYESITGSTFTGVATKEIEIDGKRAIVPRITGSAYITGLNEWIIDETDPLAYGFLMGKRVEKTEESHRSKIITNAWKLFRTKGYEQVKMSEIAKVSGISMEELDTYFASKEELLYTLSDVFDERYAELMVEMDSKLSGYDKLVLLNRELFTMIEENIPIDLLGFLYSTQMADSGDQHLLNKERLYYKFVGQIVEEGQQSGEFSKEEKPHEIVNAYAMLERGLLWDWCIGKNQGNLMNTSRKLMPSLLKGLLF
jgi:proline racemase/AcrR family transcriptional regulator